MIERLKSVELPASFSASRRVAADTIENLNREKLALGNLEKRRLHLMVEVLSHPELGQLIEENKVTLAIIKPSSHRGRNLPTKDQSAANYLLSEIGDKAVFNINLKISKRQAKQFYAPNRERFINKTAENRPGTTIWDSMTEFASSGPMTFVLIHKEDGGAVEWWRDKMGHTRSDRANPDSIRGRHAMVEYLPNNLVHGSDSVGEVKREVGVLGEILTDIAELSERNSKSFPKEKTFKDLHILPEGSRLVSIKTIYQSSGLEGMTYGYGVSFIDKKGGINKICIKEKNIETESEYEKSVAEKQAERGRFLETLGVPVPKIYGVRDDSLFQDFIENNGLTEEIEKIMKGHAWESRESLDQLIFIANVLDDWKLKSIGFVRDMVYDKKQRKFLYVDYGFELSEPKAKVDNYNLEHLATMFPKFKDYIISSKN